MNLDNIVKIEDFYLNEETGEKLTEPQLQRQLRLNIHKLFQTEYIQTIERLGIENQLNVKELPKKDNGMVTVKARYHYNSMYQKELQKIMASDELNQHEVAFIGRLTPFISFPYNDVQIFNEYLIQEKLAKFVGFGRTVMSNTMNSLEEKGIIKVVKAAKRPSVIYFNPFLYCSGVDIKEETYMMFVDSKYNPNLSADMEKYKSNRLITNKSEEKVSTFIH